MKCSFIHDWYLAEQEAVELQRELAARAGRADLTCLSGVRRIAATHATFSPDGTTAYGAAALLSYPELEPLELKRHIATVPSRYEPGLLAFSLGPTLAGALERLQGDADLMMCWGHGRAHPRRMGLATHLGMLFDRPSVGVAIRLLWGECDEPGPQRGARAPIRVENEIVGCALRTRDSVRSLFVSPGYRTDIEAACDIVLSCCRGTRIPEPLRHARSAARTLRQKALALDQLVEPDDEP